MNKSCTNWTGANPGRRWWPGLCLLGLLTGNASWAQTNTLLNGSTGSALPDTGASVLRVLGAFILVSALFFGGVWLYRNWRRLTLRKGGAPRLNIIEVKSLGQRHAIYVVGYDQQRMLLASSPGGVTLLSHLPAAEEQTAQSTAETQPPSFAEALRQVLGKKA